MYPSKEEAHRSTEEIKTVLQTGRFNLTTFQSNRSTALEDLLEEVRAEMKTQRILVWMWDSDTEKPTFRKPKHVHSSCLQNADQHLTQKSMLSMAAPSIQMD